jgi:hypothetical protein
MEEMSHFNIRAAGCVLHAHRNRRLPAKISTGSTEPVPPGAFRERSSRVANQRAV